MTFTIAELAKMWKAGERETVRQAILCHAEPQTAAEALANLVEYVEDHDGIEPAMEVATAFTHH